MPSAAKSYQIRDRLDVIAPRQAVTVIAEELGFRRKERGELAIVVSELGSNIIKYGVRGSIDLSAVNDAQHGLGLSIIAHDVGPVFYDLGMALQDGCDDHGPIDPNHLLRRDGLGIGLGAVVRLTHSLQVEYQAVGKQIKVIRYLKAPRLPHSIFPI